MSIDNATIARACEQLVYRAARYTDFEQWDDLAALFAVEGRLVRPSAPTKPIVGRADILASLRARPSRTTRHVLNNIVVAVHSGTSAHISSIVTLYMSPVAGAVLPVKGQKILIGQFEDDVVHIDGEWAFALRGGSMALEFDCG